MAETFIGVYWAARADDLRLCSSNAVEYFRLLAYADRSLERWFLQAWRKPKVATEVDVTSLETVAGLLGKGVNRRDVDRRVITELGWSLSLWNGDREGVSASTRLHCGCTSKPVGNRVTMTITRDGGCGLTSAAAGELLAAMENVWCADSGVANHSIWDNQRQESQTVEISSFDRLRSPVVRFSPTLDVE